MVLAVGHPVFVCEIRPETNEVVIGENEDIFTTTIRADHLNFMSVEDIDGEYQLESDCKWSDYHDGYIHEDNAVWSSIADSWLDSEKDSQCAECGEWYPGDYDGECYSDITGEDYCSEECADKAEAEYRKQHALVVVA